MKISVLTLFPQMLEAVLSESITGRAIKNKIIDIEYINIRDFSTDKHRRVDDYPYGGGGGMVMQPEPIYNAYLDILKRHGSKPFVIYLSPQGKLFNQEIAKELAEKPHIALLCGHYEGVDERVLEEIVDMELSIGDFVLTGGEIPAMAVIDATARMLPGVLGSSENLESESIFSGLLEYPQYTRPPEFRGKKVPDVLLSGNHAEIAKWRRRQSLLRTLKKRPELLEKCRLTEEDKKFLDNADCLW